MAIVLASFQPARAIGPVSRGPEQAPPLDSTSLLPPQSQFLGCLTRIAARDQAALAELYDGTVSRVYALALRIVGDDSLAEEVVSDVYFQAWIDAGKYDAARGSVQAWLMVICRSRALDAWRKRGRSVPATNSCELDGAAFDPGDIVPDLLEATQRHGAVHRALARLEPLQRQLLGLAFFRGLSHAEIASHLGLPLGTVKTLIRLALRKLRSGMELRALEPDAARAMGTGGHTSGAYAPVRAARAPRT